MSHSQRFDSQYENPFPFRLHGAGSVVTQDPGVATLLLMVGLPGAWDAARRIARFDTARDPGGALAFACLLVLADREEGAQFWLSVRRRRRPGHRRHLPLPLTSDPR